MGFYFTTQSSDTTSESTVAGHSRLGSKNRIGAPFLHPILSTKYWDADSKTLAYQFRDYGPGMGRWLSRDPIGERGGENLFAFLENEPIYNFDLFGLAIRWKYISPTLVDEAYQKSKHPNPFVQLQTQRRRGITVWYEGGCACKKDSSEKGSVVLVQYLQGGIFRKKWVPDGGGKPRIEKCERGFPVIRQPAYLDLDGLPGFIDGSYIDSPTMDQTLKVEAWCRCKCEDDYLLEKETIEIPYSKVGPSDDDD
jgi:RHS repeat-associated protein